MAAINNPQAVKFCNENARQMADLVVSFYRTATQFNLNVVRDFEATTGGNIDGDLVVDGSASDGRAPVAKINVGQLKFVVEQLQSALNTNSIIALANVWAVNGKPIF